MNIKKAEQIGRALIEKHGLKKDGWVLKLDQAKRRFGQCRYSDKTIRLSKPLSEINHEKIVKDTILHEIAHALVGSRMGHSTTWRRKALEIGCNGKTRYGEEVRTPPRKWVSTCPNCDTKTYRERKMRVSCGKCSRSFNPEYLLTWELNK